MLIAAGAGVNEKDKSGRTPLHYTTYYEDVSVVEALLTKGAAINEKDNEGKTPLRMFLDKGFKYNSEYEPFLRSHGAVE